MKTVSRKHTTQTGVVYSYKVETEKDKTGKTYTQPELKGRRRRAGAYFIRRFE